jgi:signal transduction histidine kinase
MKHKTRLFWVIYPSFLVILFFAMLAVAWHLSRTIRRDHYARTRGSLRAAAALAAQHVGTQCAEDMPVATVAPLCKSLAEASGHRFTVILPSGKVVGDSDKDPAEMDNHRNRTEIQDALAEGFGTSRRYSQTLREWMMYVAVPVKVGGRTAVVRASLPLSDVDKALETLRVRILLAGLVVAALAAFVSMFVSRRISLPLENLGEAAKALGRGEPGDKMPSSRVLEIDVLADTMNQMVDSLRKLEAVRRDFVANVSHELRTPITSIKGFSETLLDGAEKEEDKRRRFLEIVDREAGRLQAIVEDLLVLSRIEHDAESREIEFQNGDIGNVIGSAVQACRPAADRRQIRIEVDCQEGLAATMNVQLLEQAVVNLIDNAVKYSEPGTRVQVRGERVDDGIVIRVEDAGPGIPANHLPRLFERFYRVDKGRSRELGGTGLGLAIVKHVAVAHGGRVTVDSEPGKGSRFSIVLPRGGEWVM